MKTADRGLIYSRTGGLSLPDLSFLKTSLLLENLPASWTRDFASIFLPGSGVSFAIDKAALTWQGSLLTPGHGQGSLTMSGGNLSLREEALAEQFSLKGHLTDKELSLAPLVVENPGLKTEGHFKLRRKDTAKEAALAKKALPWWQRLGFTPEDQIDFFMKSSDPLKPAGSFTRIPLLSRWLDKASVKSGLLIEAFAQGPLSSPQGYFKGKFSPLSVNDCRIPSLQFRGFWIMIPSA